MWISNTATAMMMVPFGADVMVELTVVGGRRTPPHVRDLFKAPNDPIEEVLLHHPDEDILDHKSQTDVGNIITDPRLSEVVQLMSKVPIHEPRLLVLVGPDHRAVQTIEFGLREARDSATEMETPIGVDVWVLVDTDEPTTIRRTRAQIDSAISTFETDERFHANVEVLPLGDSESGDWTDEVDDAIDHRNYSRIIIGSTPKISVERLRERLGVTRIELAPTNVPLRRRRLVHPGSIRRFAVIFGVTFLFYLAIGGFAAGLDLLTGAISAGIVTLSLAHVALREEPTIGRTGRRLVRTVVFLPVLLWEIVKANFVIAYTILHPRLPIEPAVYVLQTETQGGLERMVLANSITLTPGTLTIDVREDEFTIHSLTPEARTALEEGRLQRLVSWVFHGGSRATQTTEGSGDSP